MSVQILFALVDLCVYLYACVCVHVRERACYLYSWLYPSATLLYPGYVLFSFEYTYSPILWVAVYITPMCVVLCMRACKCVCMFSMCAFVFSFQGKGTGHRLKKKFISVREATSRTGVWLQPLNNGLLFRSLSRTLPLLPNPTFKKKKCRQDNCVCACTWGLSRQGDQWRA